KAHPSPHAERARREASPGLRARRKCTRLAACRGSCARASPDRRTRHTRRKLQCGRVERTKKHRRRARNLCAARRIRSRQEAGRTRDADRIRRRQARSRSALRDRREQSPPRAGMDAARKLRDGPSQNRSLVSRAPRLVAALALARLWRRAAGDAEMSAAAIIFGAEGQVGRAIVSLAKARGLDVRGLSRAAADITDAADVKNAFAKFKPALAINCAAYTAVDRAEHETELANTVNIDGAETVATVCAAMNVPLLHLSTDYVFDGSKKGAYTESDAPAPINAYGRSKLAGEKRIQAAMEDYVILRTSWVYGFYGNNFLKTILRLAGERDDLRIVSDQYGCPTAAADIAEATLAAG